MRNVFITRRVPSIAKTNLRRFFDVDESDRNEPYPADKLADIVAGYDAILSTVSEKIDETVLKRKKKLSVIANYAVGLDNIDVPYAQSVGITVYNTPDVVTNSTADLTFSILLSLIRRIPQAQEFVRQNQWKAWDPELFWGEELSGKVFGILGFGKIGQAVARRAIGFGLDIIYYDIVPKSVDALLGMHVKSVGLDELLEKADYISIHLPLTSETKGLIDKRTIGQMKRNPIILNMARGGIVVTEDLVEALRMGHIRGSGLDVVSPEPLSGDHPLCHMDNVLLVPHIGTATRECRIHMAELAAQNIIGHFFKD
jgi:glyoxylate reductase